LSRAPEILHVQIKFKAATYCHARSLMWVFPSCWWIAYWQISQPWVWNYYCYHTPSLPNHINDEVNKHNPEKSLSLW